MRLMNSTIFSLATTSSTIISTTAAIIPPISAQLGPGGATSGAGATGGGAGAGGAGLATTNAPPSPSRATLYVPVSSLDTLKLTSLLAPAATVTFLVVSTTLSIFNVASYIPSVPPVFLTVALMVTFCPGSTSPGVMDNWLTSKTAGAGGGAGNLARIANGVKCST